MARLVGGWFLTATTLLLVGGLPGAAVADTWTGRDRAHDVDAYSYSPEPAPCGTSTTLDGSRNRTADLRRLMVDHRSDDVVLTAQLRGYRPAAHAWTTFHLRTPTDRFLVSVDAQRHRRTPSTFFAVEPHFPKPSGPCNVVVITYGASPCPGLTASIVPATHTASVTIPRACLDQPDWVQVGVDVNGSRGSASYSDEWGQRRHGHGQFRFVPQYGPRVAPDRSAHQR